MRKNLRFIPVIIILLLLGAFIVVLVNRTQAASGALTVSGTIEADTVRISPDTSGRIDVLNVAEGDAVKLGDVLFTLKSDLLEAQAATAQAALDSAQAGLETARDQAATAAAAVATANLQVQNAQVSAQAASQNARSALWTQTQPADIDQPAWYFDPAELLAAAENEVQAAQIQLKHRQEDLDQAVADAGLSDLQTKLANAQAAVVSAQAALERANRQADSALREAAQDQYDDAQRDLESYQNDWQDELDSEDGQQVETARAEAAAAQARLDAAIDRRNALQLIQDPLAVQIAQAGLKQAQAAAQQAQQAVAQAEKAVAQAQSQLDLLAIQRQHLTVTAPADGVILTSSVHAGEVVTAASTAMTLGRLEDLTITVYVPEDQYGQIHLGQNASVQVDSYPGASFSATVSQIAGQAEFTPRNVQTTDSRKTTVFAVTLSLKSGLDQLKPGMPADVTFTSAD